MNMLEERLEHFSLLVPGVPTGNQVQIQTQTQTDQAGLFGGKKTCMSNPIKGFACLFFLVMLPVAIYYVYSFLYGIKCGSTSGVSNNSGSNATCGMSAPHLFPGP